MEFLEGIEQLAVARYLRASFIGYPLVNAAHIAAIGALLTSVVLLDLRIVGVVRALPRHEFVNLFRRVALASFGVAVLTGFLLFSIKAAEYAAMPLFLVKLGLIGFAAANFLVFSTIESRTDNAASVALKASALLSIALWCSVLVAGRFLGFV